MELPESFRSHRSRKHHYLPRHYLEGFTQSQNLFYVYDKREDKLLPEPLTPAAMFFQNDLNTVTLPSGKSSDFMEDLYTATENTTWESFDRIRGSSPEHAVELWDKMHLFLFLLFLHWRLPSNAEHIDTLHKDMFSPRSDLWFFHLLDTHGNDAPEEVKTAIKNAPGFMKAARLIAPFAPLYEKNWADQLNNWRFLYAGDGGNWALVGDNPIITKGANDHDPQKCLQEFIFPVSGKIVLAATNKPIGKNLRPEFLVQFGVSILRRAHRFVACGRRDFLGAIIEVYKAHRQYQSEDGIVGKLFGLLNE